MKAYDTSDYSKGTRDFTWAVCLADPGTMNNPTIPVSTNFSENEETVCRFLDN